MKKKEIMHMEYPGTFVYVDSKGNLTSVYNTRYYCNHMHPANPEKITDDWGKVTCSRCIFFKELERKNEQT